MTEYHDYPTVIHYPLEGDDLSVTIYHHGDGLHMTEAEARDLRNTLNRMFPSAAGSSEDLPTPGEVYSRLDPDHPSQASLVAGRPHPLPHGVQQAER